MPVLLLLISIALGVVTYIYYKNESVFYTYLFIALVCSIILLLSELISQYRLQKHIKRGDFYENRLRLWNTISYRVKKSGEHAFNELPIGIIILSSKNEIIWSNNCAKEIFMSNLDDIPLENISMDLLDQIKSGKNKFIVEIYGNKYSCEYDQKYSILYLNDITEIVKIQNKYDSRITALGYINVDNLDNILSDFV